MRILVCKLRHHGDVLLSSPVFTAIKNRFPDAKIDAYIYEETHPMLDGHPAIHDYILLGKEKLPKWKKLWRDFGILRRIRRAKYDMVINLTEGDRGALAALVSKAKIRIGFDPEGSGMWGKAKCYTHIAKICPHPRHTVERQLDVLRNLQIFPEPEEREVTFHIPPTAQSKAEALLNNLSDFVLIHPVSRWLFKCWPEDKMAALIDTLQARGENIVLTSSPDSQELAMLNRIQAKTKAPVVNLGGKSSLKELGALIEKSKLLITVDSVPLHISSALKAPVVALFGPTSEINWAPYRNPDARIVTQNMSCRPCYRPGCADSGKSDCLETLPLTAVLKAVDELLVHSTTRKLAPVK